MSHPNIFEVINKGRTLSEPQHSAFLAAMLEWSQKSDRRLLDAFWEKAAPADWSPLSGKVTIKREEYLGRGIGRVDLTLRDVARRRILGVEVKTRKEAVSSGQLNRYLGGLTNVYDGYDLAIAFLTPFNRQRADAVADDLPSVAEDVTDALPSVKEFDKFHAAFPKSVHLSWLDLADIDLANSNWEGRDLWEQHCAHVRETISSSEQLVTWGPSGRSRQLADIFGEEAAAAFEEHMDKAVEGDSKEGGYILDLTQVRDSDAFVNALRALIESEEVRSPKKAKGTFEDAPPLIEFLKEPAPVGEAHLAIFQLAGEHENAWISGKKNYLLRVVHPKYATGVTLLSSFTNGKNVKILGKMK